MGCLLREPLRKPRVQHNIPQASPNNPHKLLVGDSGLGLSCRGMLENSWSLSRQRSKRE